MSAALAVVAVAVLLWPGDRAVRRSRLSVLTGPSRRAPLPTSGPSLPLVAAAVAAGAAAVLSTPLVAVLATASAWAGARAWTTTRARAAAEGRSGCLADGLGALAADLRSGRSLGAAAESARTACGDAVAGRALALAVQAPRAGPDGDDPSLADALARVRAAVVLSGRTGCSLAAVLGAVEDDLRARTRHRQELRTATAGPRASALVLAGLPVLGLAMGAGVGADPWRVLTTTGPGQVLLVAGVGLELAGLSWSRRLIGRVAAIDG